MAIRGIDTQMLATKPADLTAGQSRTLKQAEVHMRQTAYDINKTTEVQKERTVATVKTEGRRIGDDEGGRGGQGGRDGSQNERERGDGKPKDPMLSLPVGGKSRGERHFIDVKL
ncbi:MAG: hypothetical protein FWH06_06955 [Oscillospiraceae bacterium]|nr:hypothetical protein [Oscillospiraceae bacterium]